MDTLRAALSGALSNYFDAEADEALLDDLEHAVRGEWLSDFPNDNETAAGAEAFRTQPPTSLNAEIRAALVAAIAERLQT